MIIQLLLSAGLALCLAYALAELRRSPLSGALLTLTVLGGLYFVWRPEHANAVANMVGVGRGADLLLYCWILASLMVALKLNLKIRAKEQVMTELARKFALRDPLLPDPQAGEPR